MGIGSSLTTVMSCPLSSLCPALMPPPSSLFSLPPPEWVWNLRPNCLFLHSYCLHHPKHHFLLRLKRDLLHLLLLPHCSAPVLWFSFLLLFRTKLRFTTESGQVHQTQDHSGDHLYTVQYGRSLSKSPHLQLEEQWGESSCEKDLKKYFQYFR